MRKMPIITIIGAAIGIGIGYAAAQPFVGFVYGTIVGAVLGAWLDRKITSRGWLGK